MVYSWIRCSLCAGLELRLSSRRVAFDVVEVIWALVALHRWIRRGR